VTRRLIIPTVINRFCHRSSAKAALLEAKVNQVKSMPSAAGVRGTKKSFSGVQKPEADCASDCESRRTVPFEVVIGSDCIE
jgi:hypothetical protein